MTVTPLMYRAAERPTPSNEKRNPVRDSLIEFDASLLTLFKTIRGARRYPKGKRARLAGGIDTKGIVSNKIGDERKKGGREERRGRGTKGGRKMQLHGSPIKRQPLN